MTLATVEQIQLIDLSKLEVHPSNPRKDVGDITELAASIKSAGLIEPIVAVRHNGKFQVVAGSRRLAAARKAKLDNIPVRVMELDEAQAMAAALIENLQRKDLEPLRSRTDERQELEELVLGHYGIAAPPRKKAKR